MSEITFKAARRLHDSGYKELDKGGDLQFDLVHPSTDGIYISVTEATNIIIDCDKHGIYRLKFNGDKARIYNADFGSDDA